MSLRVLGLFVCVESPPRVHYMVQICFGFQFGVCCMSDGVTRGMNRVGLPIVCAELDQTRCYCSPRYRYHNLRDSSVVLSDAQRFQSSLRTGENGMGCGVAKKVLISFSVPIIRIFRMMFECRRLKNGASLRLIRRACVQNA